jgi:ABC-2 type transport system ATP-binding protein
MAARTELALEVRGLAKSYLGFRLHDVSFSLPRGYIMGLVGPNGAGKTTIVRLLMGLARPDAGEIVLLGQVSSGTEASLRGRIGFVHEAPAFYDHLSVGAMRSVVAPHYEGWDEERFLYLTRELDLPLQKRIGTLSKGMRTRLALALALSHHAELVVLDEPTSGLDPVVRRRLLTMLQDLISDGRTSVLLSTHITSDLERVADFITFLRDGEVVVSSSRDEIREHWAMVKGPPELANLATGPAFHGLRRGEVGFRVVTSDAAAARRLLGSAALVEPASLDDIVEHVGRRRT